MLNFIQAVRIVFQAFNHRNFPSPLVSEMHKSHSKTAVQRNVVESLYHPETIYIVEEKKKLKSQQNSASDDTNLQNWNENLLRRRKKNTNLCHQLAS